MKKTVNFDLSTISVVVEGNNEKELLENGKKALIERLKVDFPYYRYSFSDTDCLTLEQVSPGMIVQNGEGANGIVTRVDASKKYPVSVTLVGGINMGYSVTALKTSAATFEESRSRRPDFRKDSWEEGDTGYIKTPDGVKEIIVGKKTRGKRFLYLIGGKGSGYNLEESKINHLLKDDKSELVSGMI